ncbi:hypothetical protein PGT21_013801 [Puccinia graminis f. sp. tritici]|uniref:Uncharacterized protein n=1 Tax=Puccinia graminis f. sp. tritici TaxID=56615 RepID=A0A5B0NTZ2_PUCGR|nr:hypothetical protein PGT21_013801 [Puccinia graminis f. sp. tritici]
METVQLFTGSKICFKLDLQPSNCILDDVESKVRPRRFRHFSAPQHVLLQFVVWGNLLDGLVVTLLFCYVLRHKSPPLFPLYSKLHYCQLSHTQVSSCFPHCPPLSLPCTPLVTPPTPASQRTPLAALWIGLPPPLPPLIHSEPRFRLLVSPALL